MLYLDVMELVDIIGREPMAYTNVRGSPTLPIETNNETPATGEIGKHIRFKLGRNCFPVRLWSGR